MSSSTSTSERAALLQRTLGAVVAVLVLLALMEGVLRMLPTPQGLHRENPPSPESSARFVRNNPYTFSLGWDMRHAVQGRTNSMGFLSPHEYRRGTRALALIGDSFAEGEMLAYRESLAGRLEASSRGQVTPFNFGLSGAALPHYLGMAREMSAHFKFDAAVVVVVQGDYVEGFLEQDGLYRWSSRPGEDVVKLVPASERSKLKQIARESALLHYVRENLKFSAGSVLAHSGSPRCEQQALSVTDRERLSRYVDALPQALRLAPARIVLVFQSNTKEIYERVDRNRAPAVNECLGLDTLALSELRALASARGMKIVEVGALLEDHYRVHRRPLDFRPVDPHWNGLATAIIGAEIARVLGWPSPERDSAPLVRVSD